MRMKPGVPGLLPGNIWVMCDPCASYYPTTHCLALIPTPPLTLHYCCRPHSAHAVHDTWKPSLRPYLSINPPACPHYDRPRTRNAEVRRWGSIITCFPNGLSLFPHNAHLTDNLLIQPSPVLSPSELSPPPSPQETGRPSQPSLTLDSGERALQRLIDGVLPQDERAMVIDSIFSSQRATDMAIGLQERDAQTSIDAIHEVRYHSFISNGCAERRCSSPFYCLRRRWRLSILHQKSGGSASRCYTGLVLVTLYSQNLCVSSYQTYQRVPPNAVVGLGTYGRGNIWERRLRSRC